MQIILVEKMDRGLAYGESCFETFRVIDGQVFDWAGHWQRLECGLAEYGVRLPQGYGEEVLRASLREAAGLGSDVLVRLTISGGEANWGLATKASEPVLYLQCMPYKRSSTAASLRLEFWPFPLKQKCAKFSSDYAETLRVLRGVADINVLFEQGGLLLAAATANILLYRDGRWSTPSAEVGVMPGRVRDFLIRSALLREEPCPVVWLEDCEAAAVCNSGLFIQPLAYVVNIERVEPMDILHHAFEPLVDALQQQGGVELS